MLKRNLVANYLGNAWAALMSLAFVPMYIRYLGMEAYGLVGFFAVMTAWLAVLDLGMSPAISREMARYKAGHIPLQSVKDLLRTAEVLFATLGLSFVLALTLAGSWLAAKWLKAEQVNTGEIQALLIVMGAVLALRLVEGVYRSALGGLQQQVALNIGSAAMATLRAVGAYVVLAAVSPTVGAFFAWQIISSIASLSCMAWMAHRALPPHSRGRLSIRSLHGVGEFAGGVFAISILSLLLTQIDKILLSTLLPLSEFGHYSFAASVAATIYFLVTPVSQSWYPRLCELQAAAEDGKFSQTYHSGAQLVAVSVGCPSIILILFAEPLVLAWTHDAALASSSALLVSILALGNLLNCLMVLPYNALLAHGWTKMVIKTNTVAVLLFGPAIVFAVGRLGAVGAALCWVALNSIYILVVVQLMHRRVLRGQMRHWYVRDVGMPLLSALAMALAAKALMPSGLSLPFNLLYIVVAGMTSVAVAVGFTEYPRRGVINLLQRQLPAGIRP